LKAVKEAEEKADGEEEKQRVKREVLYGKKRSVESEGNGARVDCG
jgi:hypothetical protein